jgi:rhodanese-related sulfurtransferase
MFGRSNVRKMTTGELGARIEIGTQPFLLDVRNPQELIMAGAVPGVVNIPLGELDHRLGELPADKSAPIVVICQSGARSMSAARMLDKAGYAEVYNLEGGTGAWMRS